MLMVVVQVVIQMRARVQVLQRVSRPELQMAMLPFVGQTFNLELTVFFYLLWIVLDCDVFIYLFRATVAQAQTFLL